MYCENVNCITLHGKGIWTSNTLPSLLTNEAKADVVRREEFDPYIKDKSWMCAHCSMHYLVVVVRKGVIYHCKAYVPFFSLWCQTVLTFCLLFFFALWRHKICHPIENLDYLHIIMMERTLCRPAVFRELANCLCLHCPDTGVTHLWTFGALVPRLCDAWVSFHMYYWVLGTNLWCM